MTKIFFFITLAGAPLFASSSRIDVRTELSVNGRVIPRDQIKMKVTTQPGILDEIVLNLDLEYPVGGQILRSTPQVYAQAGAEAVMTLEESTPAKKIVLKVMAKTQAH